MSNHEPAKCAACGIPWADHLGCEGTCMALEATTLAYGEACETLLRVRQVIEGGGSLGLTISQRRVLLEVLDGETHMDIKAPISAPAVSAYCKCGDPLVCAFKNTAVACETCGVRLALDDEGNASLESTD